MSQRATVFNLIANVNGAVGPINQMNRLFSGMVTNAETSGRRLGSVLIGMGGSMTIAGSSMKGAFEPFKNILLDTVKVGMDFEKQMAISMGSFEDGVARATELQKAATDVGTRYALSNVDAAAGLEVLGKAGRTTTEAIAELEPIVKFAEANNLDLAAAARIVAVTMTQFADQGLTAADVTETLTASAFASTASVEQMGTTLNHAGAIAAGLGVPFGEFATVLTVLSSNGIDAMKAGTAFRGILSRLISPTKEARQELQRLGIDIYEVGQAGEVSVPAMSEINKSLAEFKGSMPDDQATAAAQAALETLGISSSDAEGKVLSLADMLGILKQEVIKAGTDNPEALQKLDDAFAQMGITFLSTSGKLKPFPEIMLDIAKATEGMSDAQRNAVIRTLATQTGMQAMNALLGVSAEEWASMTEQVNDGGHALNNMTKLTQSTVPYALEVLRGNIETLKTEIYAELRPAILQVIQAFMGLVDAFRNASPEARKFLIAILAVGAFIGGVVAPAVIFVGLLTLAFQALAVTLSPLLAIFAAVGIVILALKDRMSEVREAIEPAVLAFNALLAAFRGGATAGETTWLDTFIKKVGDVLIAAIGKAARAFQILVDTLLTIRQVLNGTWESSEGIHPFTNAVGVLTQKFLEILPTVIAVASAIFNFIGSLLDSRVGQATTQYARIGFLIAGLVGTLLTASGAVTAFALGLAKVALHGPLKAFSALNKMLGVVGLGFVDTSKKKDAHLKNQVQAQKTTRNTTRVFKALGNQLKATALAFAGFGKSSIKGLVTALEEVAKAAGKAMSSLVDLAKQAAKKITPHPATVQMMQGSMYSAGQKVTNTVTTIQNTVVNIAQNFSQTGVNLLDDIKKAAKQKTVKVVQAFTQTGVNLLDKINAAKSKTITVTQNMVTKVNDADIGKRGQELGMKLAGGLLQGIGFGLGTQAIAGVLARVFAPLAPLLLGLFSGPAGWIGLLVAGIVALIALFIANPQWLTAIGNALATFFTQTLPYALGAITAEVLNFGIKLIGLLLDGLIFAAPYLMEGIVYALAAPFYLAFQALMLAIDIVGAVVPALLQMLAQAFLIVAFDIPKLLIAVGGAIVGGLIDSIAAALSLAIDVISQLFLVIPGAIFDSVAESGLGAKLGKFFDQIFSLDIIGAVKTGLSILKELFFELPGDIIKNIGDRLGGIGKRFSEFFDELQDIWSGRLGDIITAVGEFISDVGGRFENIRDILGDLIGEIADKFTEWYDRVVEIAQGIADAFQDPMGAVLDFLSGFFDEVQRGFEEHFGQSLVSLASDKWEELKAVVVDKAMNMKDEALEHLKGLKDDAITKAGELKTDVLQRWEELKTDAIAKYEALKTEALTKFDDLRDQAETKAGELKTKVETKIEELKNNSIIKFALMVGEIFTTLSSLISDGPGTVLGLFTILKDKAIGIVVAMAGAMIGAGVAMIQGLKNGITSAIAILNPLGPLKDLATEAAGIIARIWELKSPSKLFARQGMFAIAGLALGLGQGHEGVYKQVTGVANGTLNAFRTGFAIASPSQFMVDIAHQLIDGLIVGMEEKEIELAKTIADTVKSVIDAMSTLLEFSAQINATDIIPLDPNKLQQLTNDVMLVLNQFQDALSGWSIETLENLGKKLDPAKETVNILSDMLGLLVDIAENPDAFIVPLSRFGDLKLALERALIEFKAMFDAFGTDLVDGAVAATRNATMVTDALGGIVEVLVALTESRGVAGINLDIIGFLKLALERAFIEFDLMFKFLGRELMSSAIAALDNTTNVTDALTGIVEVLSLLTENRNIKSISFDVIGQLKLALERAFIEFDLMFRFLGQDLINNATQGLENATAVTDALTGIVDVLAALVEAKGIGEIDFDVFGQLKLAIERAFIEFDLLFRFLGPELISNATTALANATDVTDALTGIIEVLQLLVDAADIRQIDFDIFGFLKLAIERIFVELDLMFRAFDPAMFGNAATAVEGVPVITEALTGIIDFLVSLHENIQSVLASQTQLEANIRLLAGNALLLLQAFQSVANTWGQELDPVLQDFATSVGDSVSALSDVLGFLVELVESSTLTMLSVSEVADIAQKLSDYALAIALAFEKVARDWDSKANPNIEHFSQAAQDSLGAISDVGDALESILSFGALKKKPNFSKLAEEMANVIDIIVRAIQEVSKDFEEKAMEALGTFADNAGKAVGLVGDIADAMEAMTGLSKITVKQVQIFKANFQVILDLIVDLKEMAKDYLDDAIEFAEIAQYIADALKAANDAIQEVTGETEKAKSGGGGSGGGGSMGRVAKGFTELGDSADAAAMSMNNFVRLYSGSMSQLKTLTQGTMPGITQVFKDLNVAGDFGHELNVLKNLTNDTFQDILLMMSDGGASIAQTVVDAFKKGNLSITTFLATTKQMSETQFRSLIGGLVALKDSYISELATALANGTDPSIVQGNIRSLTALLGSLQGQVTAFGERTRNGAVMASRGVKDAWKNTEDEMEKVGRATTDGLTTGINKGLKPVISATEGLVDTTIRTVKTGFGISSPSKVFAGIATDNIDGFVLGTNNGKPKVVSTITNMGQYIVQNWKSRVHQPWVQAMNVTVKAIIDGLVNAIKSGQSRVVQAMVAVIKAAISAAKAAAGIKSPSRAFMSIGDEMMNGLANGIKQNTGQIEDAINTVTRAAMQAASKTNLPEIALGLQAGVQMPNLSTADISSQLNGSLLGDIQPGYMNNSGNVIGTISVGDININSVNDPEYDGYAAAMAAMQAIQSAMETRKK